MPKIRNRKTTDKDNANEQLHFEARQSLIGFFDLLLTIDKRNNPQNYESIETNRTTNNTNEIAKRDS